MGRRALILGVGGQDGAYVARCLVSRGYKVFGTVRELGDVPRNLGELGVESDVRLSELDLCDFGKMSAVLEEVDPDLIFNLAGVTNLSASEGNPEATAFVNKDAPLRLFETAMGRNPSIRLFQASSALVFAPYAPAPQTEASERRPDTHYGNAKHEVDMALRSMRKVGVFACSGILFNHESPIRPETFVSQKIIKGLAQIKNGGTDCLELGLFADQRDWSHAADFANAMVGVMEGGNADEFVFASGELHSVRDWLVLGSQFLGLNATLDGDGESETLICRDTGRTLARVQHRFVRTDNAKTPRVGNPAKLQETLNWSAKYSFADLVEDMVRAELARH